MCVSVCVVTEMSESVGRNQQHTHTHTLKGLDTCYRCCYTHKVFSVNEAKANFKTTSSPKPGVWGHVWGQI